MKAHIPAGKRLSKKSKKIVEEYNQQCEEDRIRRLLKLCCVVLNDKFGFGKQRLLKFIFEVEFSVNCWMILLLLRCSGKNILFAKKGVQNKVNAKSKPAIV